MFDNTLYFQERLLVQMGAVPFLCKGNLKLSSLHEHKHSLQGLVAKQLYEKTGISLVKVYKRFGKSVSPKGLTDAF